jgi:uncharacterized metal-binding protein
MPGKVLARCSRCTVPESERSCVNSKGRGAPGCPTLMRKNVTREANREYAIGDIREFARQASIQESSCYAGREQKPYVLHPTKPRIQEICEFAQRMGYNRLGLAYCVGLALEALLVDRVLSAQGFEVVSVCCKVGSVPKETIGIADDEKINIGDYESMCNPVGQAKILNDAGTHFNIALGLCVGHDSLFFKYADAPTTVLAAKDRVLGHNPLGALYTSRSYYERLLRKGF